jgi:hypothetical protein
MRTSFASKPGQTRSMLVNSYQAGEYFVLNRQEYIECEGLRA